MSAKWPVGEMIVGETIVGSMTCRRTDCRLNDCRLNECDPLNNIIYILSNANKKYIKLDSFY